MIGFNEATAIVATIVMLALCVADFVIEHPTVNSRTSNILLTGAALIGLGVLYALVSGLVFAERVTP